MKDKPAMRLVRREDLPSILVDEISGFQFTYYVRDVPRPFADYSCEKFNRTVCKCRAKGLGVIQTPSGSILKYIGSLSATRRYFEMSKDSFTPQERAEIGSFEDCLPMMIEAWQALLGTQRFRREGGRVEFELTDDPSV